MNNRIEFSMTLPLDIVQTLSKRNRFSMGHCAKFVGHV